MADILEQLNLPSSVPLDVKTVTSDRTSIRPFQVYRGLQTYDTSAPAGIYVYEGADRTNVPASWTLLAGALTDLETGNLISWDSDATLTEATVNPIPGRVYLVDRAVTSDTVPITSGGTGADNAADARTNLGVDEGLTDLTTYDNTATVVVDPMSGLDTIEMELGVQNQIFTSAPAANLSLADGVVGQYAGIYNTSGGPRQLFPYRNHGGQFSSIVTQDDSYTLLRYNGTGWLLIDRAQLAGGNINLVTGNQITLADGKVIADVDDLIPEAVINQNAADADEPANFKEWSGTLAEYNALTPDADTFYNITDDATPAGLAAVTLTTDQTIAGTKTFTDFTVFDSSIFLESAARIPGTADVSHVLSWRNGIDDTYLTMQGIETAGGALPTTMEIVVTGTATSVVQLSEIGSRFTTGISLNNSTSVGEASTTLDFYEEGTFTIVGGNLPSGITLITNSATYIRIGNLVSLFGSFMLSQSTTSNFGSRLDFATFPFAPSQAAHGSGRNSGAGGGAFVFSQSSITGSIVMFNIDDTNPTWGQHGNPSTTFQMTYETND